MAGSVKAQSKVINQRGIIGAFPWRYEGLEACPCRIIFFEGMDEAVEAVGDAAKAIFAGRGPSPGPVTSGPDGR